MAIGTAAWGIGMVIENKSYSGLSDEASSYKSPPVFGPGRTGGTYYHKKQPNKIKKMYDSFIDLF